MYVEIEHLYFYQVKTQILTTKHIKLRIKVWHIHFITIFGKIQQGNSLRNKKQATV